jgi:acetoin utilization protein AcuB
MATNQPGRQRARRLAYICEVVYEAGGYLNINRITNLSVTGALIETSAPPPEGSILILRFFAGSEEVRARVKVVRRLAGAGMGVVFQELSPRHREAISALIADSCRETEPDHRIRLEQIMTTRLVTVGLDDEIETVKGIFERFRFHHLPVLQEDGTLAGVVSDRDLLKAVSPFISTRMERMADLQTLKKRVHQIMSRTLITASKDCTVNEAAMLMLNHRISCLPIIRPDRTVEGIVTWRDIMKWLVRQM